MRSPRLSPRGSSARATRFTALRQALRLWRPASSSTWCCSTCDSRTSTATPCAASCAHAPTCPIIILSARGEEVDRIVGLELGADDYLVKPFGFRELLARIRAVTRRAGPRTEWIAPSTQTGGLEIDSRTRRAQVDGRELALTPKEFDLLALLASDAGAVVTPPADPRVRLGDELVRPNAPIDVHVAALRKKLGDAAGSRPCGESAPSRTPGEYGRLLASYVTLTLFVLVALEIPLGHRVREQRAAEPHAKGRADAVVMATLARPVARRRRRPLNSSAGCAGPHTSGRPHRHRRSEGRTILDPAPTRAEPLKRVALEIARDQPAGRHRHPPLEVARTRPIYVAVPVAADGGASGPSASPIRHRRWMRASIATGRSSARSRCSCCS